MINYSVQKMFLLNKIMHKLNLIIYLYLILKKNDDNNKEYINDKGNKFQIHIVIKYGF